MGWILSVPQIFSRTKENNIKKKDLNFGNRERVVTRVVRAELHVIQFCRFVLPLLRQIFDSFREV